MTQQVDLLAIAAHRDDAELTCGGTLAKAVTAGHRVGILDLTQGESGTRGDAGTRAAEAERAARALGVHLRLNAGLPDAHLASDEASRLKVVGLIRQTRPRVVILPFPVGRHPDHRVASERSEEHTSELQSRLHLVCRLLLEKKKQTTNHTAKCQ